MRPVYCLMQKIYEPIVALVFICTVAFPPVGIYSSWSENNLIGNKKIQEPKNSLHWKGIIFEDSEKSEDRTDQEKTKKPHFQPSIRLAMAETMMNAYAEEDPHGRN